MAVAVSVVGEVAVAVNGRFVAVVAVGGAAVDSDNRPDRGSVGVSNKSFAGSKHTERLSVNGRGDGMGRIRKNKGTEHFMLVAWMSPSTHRRTFSIAPLV